MQYCYTVVQVVVVTANRSPCFLRYIDIPVPVPMMMPPMPEEEEVAPQVTKRAVQKAAPQPSMCALLAHCFSWKSMYFLGFSGNFSLKIFLVSAGTHGTTERKARV